MKYIYKGLTIERRGAWTLWPVGDEYQERYHEFVLLNKKEQEKCRV